MSSVRVEVRLADATGWGYLFRPKRRDNEFDELEFMDIKRRQGAYSIGCEQSGADSGQSSIEIRLVLSEEQFFPLPDVRTASSTEPQVTYSLES